MNNNTKLGFATIEVLIATVILFMAVITLSSAIKTTSSFSQKTNLYETVYHTTLSIKALCERNDWAKNPFMTGVLNGIEYEVSSKKVLSANNYSFDPELPTMVSGNFEISLYEITIMLQKNHFSKNFTFFITSQEKKIGAVHE